MAPADSSSMPPGVLASMAPAMMTQTKSIIPARMLMMNEAIPRPECLSGFVPGCVSGSIKSSRDIEN